MEPCRGPSGTPLTPYSGRDNIVAERAFPAWSPMDRDFDVVGTATLAQSDTTWTRIAEFLVPQGTEAVLREWGQGLDVCAAYSDVRWRIVANGNVYVLYPAIAQIGTLISGSMIPLNVFATAGQTIAVEAINANATSRVAYARVKGLYRPAQMGRE